METSHITIPPNDPTADYLRQWTHYAPALRAFVRACVRNESEADEVMQETSVVAWRKFSTLADHARFPQWTAAIARYEILAARRRHARERLVLDEDIVAKVADEGAEEMPVRGAQLAALEDCIAKLPRERRDLALTAYAPGASIKSLAAQMGRTEGSLYQLLARIRQELLRCIERTLAREAQA
jgi:RNA polymerase sigma-70 factor (ECF subfamily)